MVNKCLPYIMKNEKCHTHKIMEFFYTVNIELLIHK